MGEGFNDEKELRANLKQQSQQLGNQIRTLISKESHFVQDKDPRTLKKERMEKQGIMQKYEVVK